MKVLAGLSSEVPAMVDLLVAGLDLETGQEVHAAGRPAWEWRRMGHNGNHPLVCLDCYTRVDMPRQVALIPKGRLGGARRPHFAHSPGMAPPGGHGPETIWHAESKQWMCRWAQARRGRSPDEGRGVDQQRALGPRRPESDDVLFWLSP